MNYHEINGQIYWRPTYILSTMLNKEGLNMWREKVGKAEREEITQQAQDIGSEIHLWVSRLINGYKFTENQHTMLEWAQLAPEIRNGLQSWESFRKSVNPNIRASELRLVSETYKYAGTTDCVALVGQNEDLEILDWKTGSIEWLEIRLQLAAYANAYREMTGTMPVRARAIHLDKDRGYWTTKDQVIVEDLDEAFEAFLGLYTVFKYKLKTEGKWTS